MYFNINFNVFFKLIKVHLLVSELYCVFSFLLLTFVCFFAKNVVI